MKFRNRIKKLRQVKASELRANPFNWRLHPDEQRAALTTLLDTVGFAGAILARETPEGIEIIDGHLRADVAGDTRVPVLITDLTEEEAKIVLATYDPIGTMAEASGEVLTELLANMPALECPPLEELLKSIAGPDPEPIPDDNQPIDETKLAETKHECPKCGHRY